MYGLSANWNFLTIRTNSWKAWSTFMRSLALHSMYGIPTEQLKAWASSKDTWKEKGFIFTKCHRDDKCHVNYMSLMLQIRFISNQKHRKFITILDAEDLFLKFGYFSKTCMISQREDKQKTFTRSHVLFSHRTKFLLAGCV